MLIVVFFQSAVTGEHTCMVLRPLNSDDIEVSVVDSFYYPRTYQRRKRKESTTETTSTRG